MPLPNYCTAQDRIDIRGKGTVSAVKQQWLDDVDDLIEQWTGQGYKGKTLTKLRIGTGNRLLRLPSKAVSITSITENDVRVLNPLEYRLDLTGKTVTRKAVSMVPMYYLIPALWGDRTEYLVVYTEPDITALPNIYNWTAANCVAEVLMFVEKNAQYGAAITASDAGSAGRVSTSASTTFPPSLVEEIRRLIKAAIPKQGI